MRWLVLILLSLMLSLNAKALAVASDFLDNNTLILIEETSKIYSIRLQNPDTYEIKVKVDYTKELMEPIDFQEEYILQPQSVTRVEFNVTAPEYDKDSNVFDVGYTVHQLTGGPGGGIPFLTKINKNFKVRVIKNPSKFYIDYDYAAFAIIAAAFLAYLFIKRHTIKVVRHKSRRFL